MTGTNGTIYIVSDSTGETAATMVRAALVQYKDLNINIVRLKNIRTDHQVDSTIESAFAQQAIVFYTVASEQLRQKIRESAAEKGLRSFDLLGPLLNELNSYFGVLSSQQETGALRQTDDRYYRRIEAIEFTVKKDDGKDMSHLEKADVILVGISRTSKTPLSIFLSHKGWKVANIPLVLNQKLPDELFQVDQKKIVGLIIDQDTLLKIRRNRLEKFGQDPGGEYASIQHIHAELEYARKIFKQNRRWPVFNVTERALEETATEIIRIVSSRMGWPEDNMF